MRTPEHRDWKEERSTGRREADRGVCLYHDMCHETVASIKQNCVDHLNSNKEEFDKMTESIKGIGKSKLDGWIFKLFVGTLVSIAIAMGAYAAPQLFKLTETITTIYVNQQHLMQEFAIKPIK